jgi:hypothetical protein
MSPFPYMLAQLAGKPWPSYRDPWQPDILDVVLVLGGFFCLFLLALGMWRKRIQEQAEQPPPASPPDPVEALAMKFKHPRRK